ncbi:tRNA pseudouridine(55) synthase TruB [Salibacter halophilus]|uniref:tRNA pseudouridine synthase B n=1 Tax=Salibacter halophilus TaxID=1803916 RepID=A0A6N6M614_9FLAO|nr:tRNA pseudouridine(55) synthase TruB [Salibacter halophilus]KAB1063465.1 tRNA pseudouridine(55) synthase TruB [Salibacter halophilus]
MDFLAGEVLLIDKPLEWTSFDVVKKVRGRLLKKLNRKKIKVGHAGTLDPLATGLLILCTGKATKKIETIQSAEKEYTGTITLGATTPSYDMETEVDREFDVSDLTPEKLKEAAQSFVGEQLQTPPVFSAKKIDGRKAYDYARKGEDVKMRQNLVHIYEFELTRIELPEVDFRVKCSKGTYIRSLAYDFGQSLNNGGYLSALRRTAIGDYRIEDALSIEEVVELVLES